ncbi:MAG: hypothetical protein AAF654_14830, partial [Myxococcota bacterium]
ANGGSTNMALSSSWVLDLASGAEVELHTRHQTAGNETLVGGDGSFGCWFSGRIEGSASPFVDDSSSADSATVVPIYAERPLTCDLWVY